MSRQHTNPDPYASLDDREKATLQSCKAGDLLSSLEKWHSHICQEQKENTNVEIEARVGISKSGEFISGVKQDEFGIVLEHTNEKTHPTTYTVANYHYQRGSLRHRFGDDMDIWEIKQRHDNTFLPIAGKDYGLRVSISTEKHLSGPPDDIDVTTPKSTRHIERVSRTFLDFEIDFSRVVTKVGSVSTTTYEVEFELSGAHVASHTCSEFLNYASRMVICAAEYLRMIFKTRQNYFADIKKTPAPNPAALVKFVCDTIPGCDGGVGHDGSRRFPGAMPVNFGRTSFRRIQEMEYFVSEKTDGVRHFLLVLERQAYLVTRKNEFFLVDFPALVEYFGGEGVSLFDGEIVRNIAKLRPVFMAFDVMVIHGQNVALQPYGKRLDILREEIEQYNETAQFAVAPPFDVLIKKFYHKHELAEIFKCIHFDPAAQSYVIRDELRMHRSDGIVFSPDLPYIPFANREMFKWKYVTHWTIDYGIAASGRFFCNDGPRPVELRPVCFGVDDQREFEDAKRRYGWNDRGVVECSLNTFDGSYHFHVYRYDKPAPNNITVAIDTLEAMACNISKEELIYRCRHDTSDDRWDERRAALLEEKVRAYAREKQAASSN